MGMHITLGYDLYPKVLLVLTALSEGQIETRACVEAGIPVGTFRKYVTQTPELQEQYEEALILGRDALAEALLDPDGQMSDHMFARSDPKMAKVMSDNIKWFLSKKDVKRFGDRMEVNVHHSADTAITEALAAARGRTSLLAPPTDVVDAQFEEIEPDIDEMCS